VIVFKDRLTESNAQRMAQASARGFRQVQRNKKRIIKNHCSESSAKKDNHAIFFPRRLSR
ncbi:MAG: hypothetical protein ABJA62_12055, partial [Luteimonas sp.]